MLDAVCYTLVQSRQTPLWKGDTDDWNLKRAVFHHCIERGKYIFVGKIARYSKDHQCV
jgi:hypothetical protein